MQRDECCGGNARPCDVTFELHTKRLTLRPVAAADTLELHELWTSAGVRRFLWDDEVISLTRTTEAISESVTLFHTAGLGLWAARDRTSNALIGFAGFWYFRQPPQLELLYGVRDSACGSGYATEAARAVVEYGTGTLGMRAILASTDDGNTASMRVLEKLGFTKTESRVVDGRATSFYSL